MLYGVDAGLAGFNLWGGLKEKQSELRGIAANYEYYLNKILLGRVQEVGLGTLMELHDIFRLNIPGYAARYPGIGHDDARGYKAVEEWICTAAPRWLLPEAHPPTGWVLKNRVCGVVVLGDYLYLRNQIIRDYETLYQHTAAN